MDREQLQEALARWDKHRSSLLADDVDLFVEAARKVANLDSVLLTWTQLQELAGFLSTMETPGHGIYKWISANDSPEAVWEYMKRGLTALGVTEAPDGQ